MGTAAEIAGYDFGAPELERSPVSQDDLGLLKATLLWTEDDDRYLRMAGEVLADQVDAVLDVWYGYVGSHPHLVHYFTDPDGKPIGEYLDRVRARFAQWVRDVCARPHDQAWLDYQHEVAVRHTREKKNRTDDVDSVAEVPLRYLVGFIFPITATMREFLAARGHDAAEVDAMHTAWFKAVVLHVCLWSRPYAPDRW
jgi:hypothetical protein